jgi:hypothetical protein
MTFARATSAIGAAVGEPVNTGSAATTLPPNPEVPVVTTAESNFLDGSKLPVPEETVETAVWRGSKVGKAVPESELLVEEPIPEVIVGTGVGGAKGATGTIGLAGTTAVDAGLVGAETGFIGPRGPAGTDGLTIPPA